MVDIPNDLKYTEEHEWARVEERAFKSANRAYELDPANDEIVMVLAELCTKSRWRGLAEHRASPAFARS